MINELKDNTLFQNVFQSSAEGIMVVDDAGFIIKANPASEQIFGYNKEELIQKKVEILIPNKFKKKYKNHREGYITKPNARLMEQDLEFWGLKKDGSQFPLEISLTPTTLEGKQVVIAFVIDTSKQKKTEEKLKINQTQLKTYSKELEGKVTKRIFNQ